MKPFGFCTRHMAFTVEAMETAADAAARRVAPGDALDAFTGPERVVGVLPFVADVSSTPRWHHLLFTEDKILAVPAFAEPAADAAGLFIPTLPPLVERYPSVRAVLRLVAIPQPLTSAHVTAVIPYAIVRSARLTRSPAPQAIPELEIRAGRQTTWWFLKKEDEDADGEKACYARDLLLLLLPFPVELGGFSEAPRPPERHLRRGARQPLPLLIPVGAAGPKTGRPMERDRERDG